MNYSDIIAIVGNIERKFVDDPDYILNDTEKQQYFLYNV